MSILFDGSATEPTDLRGVIYQAIGAASACWVHGVFDSTMAEALAEEVIGWIEARAPIGSASLTE